MRRVEPALQRQIDAAIDRGVAYLQKIQQKDGRWPYQRARGLEMVAGTGGLTALCLYALAASQVPAPDPSIRRGLSWIKKNPLPFRRSASWATYSASLLVLALTRIDADKHKKRIAELAGLIAAGQLGSDHWTYNLASGATGPARKGGRGGGGKRGGRGRGRSAGPGDNSNSQFAVLALWAAEALAGAPIANKTWKRIRDAYKTTQHKDGGWSYRPTMRMHASPSMTAAGLVSYVYAFAALAGGHRHLPSARAKKISKKGLQRFLSLPRNFNNYYFAYSLERVGTVLDVPLSDWYIDGARTLIHSQSADGHWGGKAGHGDGAGAYDTALALLFLSRATRRSITPGGDPDRRRAQAAVTKSDQFPDPAKAGNLERSFEYYRLVKPQTQIELVPRFGRAGPAVVGFLIRKLHHPDLAHRAAAIELLQRLIKKRFFFEPNWPEKDRSLMLKPIDDYWRQNHARLAWDKTASRFAVR